MKKTKLFLVGNMYHQRAHFTKYKALKDAKNFGTGTTILETWLVYENGKFSRFVQGREWIYELGKLRKL